MAAQGDDAALRALSGDELERRYAELHRQVFACYEDADLAAESGRLGREAATAQAQAQAAPLIERARALHAERVRRLRLRARRWWIAAGTTLALGAAAIAWLLARTPA
ncbi:hypothetical protein LDO32_10145 [Luteimonas sp. Y-2-2-4F]|nr:hypothetical protein [Luteimonas sp. Y-2-2-4F]MCD9032081.1 hypothetical protein [Luteimonas sp. Y-2-2-4F]